MFKGGLGRVTWETTEFSKLPTGIEVEANTVPTTLTIDADVEILLKEAVGRQAKSLEEVANDALRRALSRKRATQQRPYTRQAAQLGDQGGDQRRQIPSAFG